MIAILPQADPLTRTQQAIRDHFQTGGSITQALLVLVCVLVFVLLLYGLTRRQERGAYRRKLNDPHRLFRNLQEKLELSADQRRLLDAVARDNNLSHPTVILLSPRLFDENVIRWTAHQGVAARRHPDETGLVAVVPATRHALFPAAGGSVVRGGA